MSADGWLGITIERRLLEQRGQDRGCYEKNAVERLLGGVAHRLDPHQALGTQRLGVKQDCPASMGCYRSEKFLLEGAHNLPVTG